MATRQFTVHKIYTFRAFAPNVGKNCAPAAKQQGNARELGKQSHHVLILPFPLPVTWASRHISLINIKRFN